MSSTDGSPTKTCWKRRSSAGSFSMRWRYSSSVVAPTMRSSPRASIGLIMLPASIAPSPVAPAPTIVCSSSMKVMIWPAESVISLSTALSRSSNSPRYLAPATIEPRSSAIDALAAQRLRDVAGDDPLGQALDDRRLADAGLADEHRVVLGAPGEHLHDAADLGVPADHRVELALAGALGEVDGRTSPAPGRCPRGRGWSPASRRAPCANASRSASGVAPCAAQQLRRPAPPAGGQPDQQVLGGDVLVAHLGGELLGGGDRGAAPRGTSCGALDRRARRPRAAGCRAG